MKTTSFLCLASILLAIPTAHAATIFSHTFDGGTGGLNGTAVDGGTGSPQNWTAADVVTANGVFSSGRGSATLAFSPQQNTQYQLDARILNVTGDGNWVAFGFANGQNTGNTVSDRFITGNVVGTAWTLFRGSNSANPNVAQNGTGALAPIANGGTTDGVNWTAQNNSGGSIDLRILLDTTGGSGNWTATWFAKETTDLTYTTVRPTDAVLQSSEANYTSVGFAFSSGATDGTLESFSLTAVPEPSAALLGGLGMLALLRRRRR